MNNKAPQDIERYLVKKAVDIVNAASEFEDKNVQERLNILKEQLRLIWLDAHSDGYELGFEHGVNQQLGIDI